MAHVLIINPNTRQALTAQLCAQVEEMLQAGALRGAPVVIGATAAFGFDYIANEQSYAVAAHAVLQAWQAHVDAHGVPRAVLVACFGDPGVWALREMAAVPVMGLAEAAMREADACGPFGIVTGGTAWGPMLERLARGMQLSGPAHLRWTETVGLSGGELAADPDAAMPMLGQACEALLDRDARYLASLGDRPGRDGAALRSIILGGAAFGGWTDRLASACQGCMPIDSVQSGARWLQSVV